MQADLLYAEVGHKLEMLEMIAIILFILNALAIAIIVRSLLSWVDPQGRNVVSQLLFQVTEPVLAPIRRLMGGGMGGWDLSPMIAVLVIYVLEAAIGSSRF